ncbi:hypothetical protein [Desulfomicrobium macestii]
MNWQIVHDVAERHVVAFAEYMREVEGWLGRRGGLGKVRPLFAGKVRERG